MNFPLYVRIFGKKIEHPRNTQQQLKFKRQNYFSTSDLTAWTLEKVLMFIHSSGVVSFKHKGTYLLLNAF